MSGRPLNKGAESAWDVRHTPRQVRSKATLVCVAKLSMGALALNDIWFGGQTMNPWLLEEGSSGSSAGPGAATGAGLVGSLSGARLVEASSARPCAAELPGCGPPTAGWRPLRGPLKPTHLGGDRHAGFVV